MNRKLNVLTLLLLAAAFSISVSAQSRNKPTASPCPADITALTVDFRDDATDLYRSDTGENYVTHKVRGSNLEAKFQRANCTYDFTMNLNFTSRTSKLLIPNATPHTTYNSEFFNFDRVASVPITSGTLQTNTALQKFCDSNNDGVLDVKNVVQNADGTVLHQDGIVYDNYAGCGYDAGGYYVRRAVGIDAGPDYSFRFQNTGINATGSLAAGTDYIRVYHPNAQTWILSPEYSSRGVLINKNDNTTVQYNVPFEITVTCPTSVCN